VSKDRPSGRPALIAQPVNEQTRHRRGSGGSRGSPRLVTDPRRWPASVL